MATTGVPTHVALVSRCKPALKGTGFSPYVPPNKQLKDTNADLSVRVRLSADLLNRWLPGSGR